MIFKTQRLTIRPFHLLDLELLYDIMSNPIVMDALPRPIKTKEETEETLNQFIQLEKTTETKWWCITEVENDHLIGLCGFKQNEKNEAEIGYCLNEQFWGKGYGTEVVEDLIKYGFNQLQLPKITADVTKTNDKSVKILEKFMKLEKEFYNESDQCMDCRYFVDNKS